MSGSGINGVSNTPNIDNSQAVQFERTEANTIKHERNSTIETDQNSSPTPAASTSPTDGARDATASHPLSHDDIERMTEERLNGNSDFQDLMAKQAALKSAEIDFSLVDANTIFKDDGIITIQDLRALVGDELADPAARAAAQRLLNNTSLWNELASGVTGENDNKVGTDDVSRLIQATKAQIQTLRNDTRNEIRAENAPPATTGAPPAGSSPTPAATGSSGSSATGTESQIPKPPPSTKPGIDGANENLANGADYLQQRMMELANKAAADPAQAQKYMQESAMLQNQYQALTNMMNQLTQMISNMSKMWSDVAMNSIRNVK